MVVEYNLWGDLSAVLLPYKWPRNNEHVEDNSNKFLQREQIQIDAISFCHFFRLLYYVHHLLLSHKSEQPISTCQSGPSLTHSTTVTHY